MAGPSAGTQRHDYRDGRASGAAQFRQLVVRLRQRHLVVVILQFVTGICLATVYAPAADRAWQSLIYLNYDQPLGWYLRALHGWGSNFMVGLVCIHMAQVFLFGAYKYPRELTWIAGVVLLLSTLGMAFTGQVLRFDQNAYWGLGIGASIAGRTPIIGCQGRRSDPGRSDNRRRDAVALLHPARLRHSRPADLLRRPASVPGTAAGHQRMADARTDRQARYLSRRVPRTGQQDGEPFFPFAAQKDLVFVGLIILSLLVVAAVGWADRSQRRARPRNHSDRTAPRLLLPVVVRRFCAAAAVDRNLPDADRTGGGDRPPVRHPAHFRDR